MNIKRNVRTASDLTSKNVEHSYDYLDRDDYSPISTSSYPLDEDRVHSIKTFVEQKIMSTVNQFERSRTNQKAVMRNLKRVNYLLTVSVGVLFLSFMSICIMMSISMSEYTNNIEKLTHSITEQHHKIVTLENRIVSLQSGEAAQMKSPTKYEISNISIPHKPSNIFSDAINHAIHNSTQSVTEPPQETPPPVEEKKPINTTDINSPSNLTADQLNQIINTRLSAIGVSSSKFTNLGQALHDMETTYNVNALFCLSIGSLESGHGTSKAAKNRNNLFGLVGRNGLMQFDSPTDCVMYWGKLMRNSYLDTGRTTISSIQKKYCPSSTSWTSQIQTFMKIYGEIASNLE